MKKLRNTVLLIISVSFLMSAGIPAVQDNRTYSVNSKSLKNFVNRNYWREIKQRPGVKVIAYATFPANDINPGAGNGMAIFKREKDNFMLQTPWSYPLKIAARVYDGKHTGYRRVYLKSPVGIFGVHRGTKNGSRYMSWQKSVKKIMSKAEFVPAFGLKVAQGDKPQKHFSYAIHSVPVFYNARMLRHRQFKSLGCYSLLPEHMRRLYKAFNPVPTYGRLMVAWYDTISIDKSRKKIYIYQDIYKRGSNSFAGFVNEIKKKDIPLAIFSWKKIKKALQQSRHKFLQVYSFARLGKQ
ncbi:MAG TPA: hypothetical protein VKS21_04695 [Spirochaetota bacterium]|nr:hypothetical protein [Spirochaetota bacterium]